MASPQARVAINMRGFRKLVDLFEEFGDDGVDAAEGLIQETANKVRAYSRGNLDRNDTVAWGDLKESVQMDRVRWVGGRKYSGGSPRVTVRASAGYAAFVEFGTKARGASGAMFANDFARSAMAEMGYVHNITPGPPIPPGSITDWLYIRSIPPEFDFVIRRKIGEVGVWAQPFFFPAIEKAAGELPKAAAIRYGQLVAEYNRRRLG